MEYLDTHNSSSIKWSGYEPKEKVLHVVFIDNDDEYEYYKVPLKKWKELKEAPSKGKYINQQIKPFHDFRKG